MDSGGQGPATARRPAAAPGIGVVVPLMVEARGFSPRLQPSTPQRCGQVLVCVSGMGAERATRSAELLANAGCRALLSFGTAGALMPDLASGDLLLTPHIRSEGASTGPQPTPADDVRIALSAALRHAGRHRLLNEAVIASSEAPVEAADARQALAARTGAAAVDLESRAIAAVAGQRGLPFLAVRCIVDTVQSGLPEGIDHHIDAFGRPRWSLGLWILARPSRLPALLGLGGRMRKAGRTLGLCARILEGLAPGSAGTAS